MGKDGGCAAVRGDWRTIVQAAGIVLLAALPYVVFGVSPNFMVLDDNAYIYENPLVRRGLTWETTRWAFTTLHAANWHPLTWLSHLLDATLFGLDARGHHATSILLHALNAGLLFAALRRMTGAPGRSAFVAALFGVHPLHVESVAWVAERKDVLSGLFFMFVLLAWTQYVRRRKAWLYLLALVSFALGLAAKPMLVTLPFLLLLLDFWPLGRIPFGRAGRSGRAGWRAILLEKAPFLALSVASGAITVIAQRAGGAVQDLQVFPLGARVANAVAAYAAYLATSVWPARLAVFYPYPSAIPWPTVLAAAVLLAVITLAVISRLRTSPFLAAGWCWFTGMLVPVIGFVQVGIQARADRYTYLPLIGVFVGAAWLAAAQRRPVRRALAISAGIGILVLAGLSARQAGYWKDSETLFSRTLAVTRDNWPIRNNLGLFLATRGRHQEALVHYREVTRLRPDLAAGHYNIGTSLSALRRYAEAVASYRAALQFDHAHSDARYNLGNALAALGRHEEALAQYREVVRLSPDAADAHNSSGGSLAALGRFEEAAASFRTSLRLRPDMYQIWTNLGVVLAELGRREEAVASLREALRLRPDYAPANAKLSTILSPGGP